MNYYKRIHTVLLKTSVLLLLYQVSRVCFFILNYKYFESAGLSQIIPVFFKGILFDLSSICVVQSVLFVAYLIPFRFIYNKSYIKILDIVLIVLMIIQLTFNFIDCEYFKFINKRTTFDIIKDIFISNDVLILMPRFIWDFWYIPILIISSSISGWFCFKTIDRKINLDQEETPRLWQLKAIPLFIVIIAFNIIGIRGIGMKPLQLITASKFTTPALFPLIYNTPFTILHTMKGDGLKPLHYFDHQKAKQYFDPVVEISSLKNQKEDNVIIIILESFSYDYVSCVSKKKGYTPFLDSLAAHSLLFDNAFANGKKSIEAVPSILASLPNLLEEPYITSQYGSNTIAGLPFVLKGKGYETSFFHGGRNGTMGFDNFCKAAGVQKYFGMNEYVGPEAYDGDWGIRDEEFLQFFAGELSKMKQPFFSSVFTISSHHPYTVPQKYKNRFRGGNLPIYKSIEYADYSLQQFFNRIKHEPWYNHTLFVFTADHAAQEEDNSTKKRADLFRIPIMFYHPGDSMLKGVNGDIVQQIDIMPSVLDYLGISGKYVCFGKSVFDKQAQRLSIQYLSGVYSLIQNNTMIGFDGEKILETETLRDSLNTKPDASEIAKMLDEIKSISQQFNERLIRNDLVIKK